MPIAGSFLGDENVEDLKKGVDNRLAECVGAFSDLPITAPRAATARLLP